MTAAPSPLRAIASDPVLRLTAVLAILQGAFGCSFGPYMSVLAVRQFGLGDRGYAAMMLVSSLLTVAAAIGAGIRADQTANRRSIALWSGGVMMLGTLLMVAAPGAAVFVLAHAVILPFNALYGQLFAQSRLAAQGYDPATRDGIQTTLRALFALPFVVVLPIWALAFAHAVPILSIYPFTLGLAVLMTVFQAN